MPDGRQAQRFFEISHDLLAILSREGKIVAANPAWHALLGWSPREVAGQTLFRFLHAEDLMLARSAIAGSESGRVTLRFQGADGRDCACECTFDAPHDMGEVYFCGCGATDPIVSSQLLEQRRRVRDLIDRSPDPIAIHGAGKVRYFNPAAGELLGISDLAQAVGTPVMNYVHPDYRVLVAERMRRIRVENAMVQRVDEKFIRVDGTAIDVEVLAMPVDWEGEFATLVLFRDIGERKRTQETLRRREEELQHAQKMEALGRLAGGMAHDFNNLLMIVDGMSELLGREEGLSTSAADRIAEIQHACRRGASLTRDLLVLGKKQVLQPSVLNANAVLQSLVRLLRPVIGVGVELIVPPCPNAGRVYADPVRLEQVLLNLAINARDAMPRGGRLEISARRWHCSKAKGQVPAGDYVVFQLRDSGHGMDPYTLSRAFEPFFTTKSPEKGTGLGLSTAYGIVTQLEGHIKVSSRVGRGTTFRVLLPETVASPLSLDDDQVISESLDSNEPGPILVVEDEPVVLKLVCETLRAAGYEVIGLTDPEEALSAAGKIADLWLLVTDVVMPKLAGPALYAGLREKLPGLAVIFMSGFPADELSEAGTMTGAPPFLQKPFGAKVLRAAVRKAWSGAGAVADK